MSDIINKDGGHMEIENNIFKKAKIDYSELESYGFKKMIIIILMKHLLLIIPWKYLLL